MIATAMGTEQLELAAVILMNVDIRLVLGQPARVGGHMGA